MLIYCDYLLLYYFKFNTSVIQSLHQLYNIKIYNVPRIQLTNIKYTYTYTYIGKTEEEVSISLDKKLSRYTVKRWGREAFGWRRSRGAKRGPT